MGILVVHPRHDLLALLEHRLDSAQRARVEAHLAVCARCRAEAAEMSWLTDNLAALPVALRPLVEARGGGRAWAMIWSRIHSGPMRRTTSQLSFYLSVAVTVFVFALTIPSGIGSQQLAASVAAIETPLAAQATPATLGPDGRPANLGAAASSTALVRTYVAARPIPVPTPVPGPKG